MFSIIWKYKVNRWKRSAFEQEYGIHGAWRNFLSESCDYRGSHLMKSMEDDSYILIDHWNDESSYAYFKNVHHEQFRQLSEKFRPFYVAEQKLGVFNYVD